MIPMVGQVTTAPGAKLHFDHADRAHCNSGNAHIIAGTAIQLADANPSMLCMRCLPAIRAAADTAIRAHAGGGISNQRIRPIEPLRRLRKAIRTPQEKAADELVRAKWLTTRTPKPGWKPSVFGQIAQGHADANQPTLFATAA